MQNSEINRQLSAVGDWPITYSRVLGELSRESKPEWIGPEDWERSTRRWEWLALNFLIKPKDFRFFNPQPGQSLELQGFAIDPFKKVCPLDAGRISLSALVIPGFNAETNEEQVMSLLRLHPVRRAVGVEAEVLTRESEHIVLGRIRQGFSDLIPCSIEGFLGNKNPLGLLSGGELTVAPQILKANGTGKIVETKELARFTVVKPVGKREPLEFRVATDSGQYSGIFPRHSPLSTSGAKESLDRLTRNIVRAAIGQMEKAVK